MRHLDTVLGLPHALTPRLARYSLDAAAIEAVLRHARPLGHHEDAATLNLGFGFLYYALARVLRPRHVLVIGSGYGFSVVCFALALRDNGAGRLSFVDPSYSLLRDGPLRTIGGAAQWSDPQRVVRHFQRFGVERIVTHWRLRSDEFFARWAEWRLPRIALAFIDGSHAYADVRHDFLACLRHARRNSYFLLHDSNIWLREWVGHAGVRRWLRRIAAHPELFESVDFPFASGLAIVRVRVRGAWKRLAPRC